MACRNEFIDQVFAVMALCPQHTFQVLTKRPERMKSYLSSHDVGLRWSAAAFVKSDVYIPADHAVSWTRDGLPNAWLGVSVENQACADERIPILLQTPAAVRFLSVEPLLAPVHLEWEWLNRTLSADDPLIHWVIVGGESGPHARPCNVEWIRDLVRQCRDAGVPPFVKQLGANSTAPLAGGTHRAALNLRHSKGGDPAEWPAELRVREYPTRIPRT